MSIKTIFKVWNSDGVSTVRTSGIGQTAASAVASIAGKGAKIVIKGFEINGQVKPVVLESHWKRIPVKK